MKKRLITFILVGCLTAGLTACSSSESTESASDTSSSETTASDSSSVSSASADETSEDGSLGTIGILMPSLEAEFFVNTANSVAETVEAAGYTSNIQTFDYDANQAVSVIENFITDGVVGIAYMTIDTSGDDALKEAMEQGVAVLTCGVETENYDVCQIADNYNTGYMIGQMAAEYIDENFDGECQVAYMESTRSQNMIDRINGYKDALEELCPGAEVVYSSDIVGTGDGASFAENLNTLYPDCKVVLSYSDTYAKEVAEVWNALGYPEDAAVFGHDAEEVVLADIAEGGYIKGTIYMGDTGVAMGEGIIAYLNGEYESHTLLLLEGEAVTPENVSDYYES